jgi:tetratricopeptide (TPR) repeat protein
LLKRVSRKFARAIFLAVMSLAATPSWSQCTVPAQFKIGPGHSAGASDLANLGAYYADHGQFSCAAGALKKALDIEPYSARYNYLFGLSLYSAGQTKEAIAPLETALRLDPSLIDAHATLAAALDRNNAHADAEMQWRLVLAAHPGDAAAMEGLSLDLLADRNYSAVISLLSPSAASRSLSGPLAIDLSTAYSKVGLLEQAASVLRTRLEEDPDSLPIVEALSGVLILQSRFEDATGVLGPLAKKNPSDLHAQILYLQTLVLAHEPSAETFAQQLAASHPHHAEVSYFRGLLRQQDGDNAGAKQYFEQSVRENPNDADSHYRLGAVLAALNENTAAQQQLEKALALGSSRPELHMTLAKALRATGNDRAAEEQLNLYHQQLQAQEARAQAAAKAQQGDQAEAAGNFAQSAQDYRDALALDPHEAVLAYKLAMALDKTGDRDHERAALNEAVGDDPHMAVAQNQLGYLDSVAGDTEAAIHHFQLALKDDPASVKTWLNLAASLCLESKWAEARDALHHVQALDSGNANAAALLHRIDEVTGQH